MAEATGQLEQATGRTMADLASAAAERFGDHPAVRFKDGDGWAERSYAEVGELVDEVARGLVELGVGAGDTVCVLADTRPEWTYASLAIWASAAITVPIYPTDSAEECQWVLSDSGARVLFCDTAEQVEKIAGIRDELPDLEHVVVMVEQADGAMTLDELREKGRGSSHGDELQQRREQVDEDDTFLIVYTSGTTGKPKGVELTHANAASVCSMIHELSFVEDDDVTYLYLPLAHVFALITQIGSWDVGAPIIYFGGDPKQIIGELAETNPTYFPSVPRIFEKIYQLATAQAEQGSDEDRERFQQAIQVGLKVREMERRGEDVPDELRQAFDQAEENLYSKVRPLFGNRMRQAITGAAPIAKEILEFFYACGVKVFEGYGMTETIAVGCVNRDEGFKFGTVGLPMPGVEAKTSEDGELMMRGPNVFKRYRNNEDATKETFTDDGWLLTGDLAEIDDEGFVTITGRKKDLIITAGGKNITPSNMENDIKQCRFVSQAVMHGDRRPYPVALITLDPEEIVPWAKEHGKPEDLAELSRDDDVRQMIQSAIDQANNHHARVAQVKKFAILDHDLSQETGELTPTLKVKRNVVEERYADLLDSLYSG